MDSVLCLEDELSKAQINKERGAAVFFDLEKAYDMLSKEGLLIKLHTMRIGGKVLNWMMDILHKKTIQVKVGSEMSSRYEVDNGVPQGSVISRDKMWGKKWGFSFSVEKSKVMFFTRKRIRGNTHLKLYGNNLETVESFTFF